MPRRQTSNNNGEDIVFTQAQPALCEQRGVVIKAEPQGHDSDVETISGSHDNVDHDSASDSDNSVAGFEELENLYESSVPPPTLEHRMFGGLGTRDETVDDELRVSADAYGHGVNNPPSPSVLNGRLADYERTISGQLDNSAVDGQQNAWSPASNRSPAHRSGPSDPRVLESTPRFSAFGRPPSTSRGSNGHRSPRLEDCRGTENHPQDHTAVHAGVITDSRTAAERNRLKRDAELAALEAEEEEQREEVANRRLRKILAKKRHFEARARYESVEDEAYCSSMV